MVEFLRRFQVQPVETHWDREFRKEFIREVFFVNTLLRMDRVWTCRNEKELGKMS